MAPSSRQDIGTATSSSSSGRKIKAEVRGLNFYYGAAGGASLAKSEKEKLDEATKETLDELLPEAYGAVKDACRRLVGQSWDVTGRTITWDMVPFDVQLIGGIVLHEGKISEMATGEGKTLVATMPVYLNALPGRGVHLVTVNDYLAKRDSEWMGLIYGFLGLKTGVIVHGLDDEQRKTAYDCDVTYGTNNELGFDYLRDNMKYRLEDMVQRGHAFAIVDEVDSILIDEARTPLIISGQAEDHTELYVRINAVVPRLKKQIGEADPRTGEGVIEPGDFTADEKSRQVFLTEAGHENAEALLLEAGLLVEGASLYDAANITLMHHLYAALRAHSLFFRDQHYVVQNGEVVIVDEFTGRLMPGRRWSDGLHQAVEAKEGVQIQQENQTLATITFQNYFRMYNKLAGMTGTAETEAGEFWTIYKLDVVSTPTNLPVIRKDQQDLVYKTKREKYKATIDEIEALRAIGRPSLVGTTSVEVSELLSRMLQQKKIPHNVLNAKQHAREEDEVQRDRAQHHVQRGVSSCCKRWRRRKGAAHPGTGIRPV